MTELEFRTMVLKRLQNHFRIDTEVVGYHKYTRAKYRIDAVLTPIEKYEWANPYISFGVEFKNPLTITSGNLIANTIRQAYDYIHTDFQIYGKIPVLICPIKVQNHYTTDQEIRLIKRILAQFGIGEIVNDKNYKGLKIVFGENQDIWSERFGVELGKNYQFKNFRQ